MRGDHARRALEKGNGMIDLDRRKDWLAVALLLLVVALYFSPVLFENQTLFFRDITGLLYPFYHYLYQSLHEGIYPFWNPAVFNGAPFVASLAPGILYPPVLIFLLDDFTFAYNLFNVGHYALFTVSIYLLARHLGISIGAALCSSLTALFSGLFLASIYYFLVLSWLPAVFLCFRKYTIDKNIWCLPGTAVCLAFQLLCGPPESCIMTLALICSYNAVMEDRKVALLMTAQLGAITILAIGLAAPQLMSTMALMKETVRSGGLTFEDHAYWSLEPGVLPTIILPKDHSGFMEKIPADTFGFFQSFHMGVFAALFLFAGLLFLNRQEIRFWLVVFVVGIFLALGKFNPLYEFIYNGFPLLKLFRYPEKFYLFSGFAQIFLVGHVADELLKRPFKPFGLLGALVVLCAAIMVASYWVPGSKPLVSLACLVVFGFCCHFFFSGKISPSVFKMILLVLIFFDLTLKHHMLAPMIDRRYFEQEPAAAKQIKQDKSLFRVYSADIKGDLGSMDIPAGTNSFLMIQIIRKERLHPYWGVIYGIASPVGLTGMGMELQDVRLWGEIFEKSSPEKRARILQRGNVKYLVTGDETAIEGRVRALDDVLPRAFLVPQWRLGEDPKLLNTYYDESFDPRKEVLLSEPAMLNAAEDFDGTVEVVRYEPNRVALRSQQNGEGFLVLLDSWFPGWTATVDGRPEHIFRANHFYRAVKTGAGTHTVEFSFEPPGFRAGLLISGATFCALTAFLLARFRKRTAS